MEDIDYRQDRQSRQFVFSIMGLSVIAIAMVLMLVVALQCMPHIDGAVFRLLANIAWLSLTLLLAVLVFLAWTIMRFIRHRLLARRLPPSEEHLDAWEAAGERMNLDNKAANSSSGQWREDQPDHDID